MKTAHLTCVLLVLITAAHAGVNTSLIGVSSGETFTYTYLKNSVNPVAADSSFSLTITSITEGVVHYTMKNSTQELEEESKLDEVGEYFIYTDWEYWRVAENIRETSPVGQLYGAPSISEDETTFKISFSNVSSRVGITYETKLTLVYAKVTGAINYYSYSALIYTDVVMQTDEIVYELVSVSGGSTSNDSLPLFSLFFMTPFFPRKRRNT